MTNAPLLKLMQQHLMTVFGEKNTASSRAAIEKLYSEDCVCTDYKAEVVGRVALDEKIEALHARYPGYVFAPTGEEDAHHNVVRMHWRFGPPAASEAITGLDIAFFENGLIWRLYVFLDKVPST